MNELAQLHCVPIKADTRRLNAGEVSQLKARLPDWCTYDKDGQPRLEKVFKFKNFDQALAFTNQVAQAANAEDHHPALLTEWGKVTVTWWSHRITGLTLNDFIMAAKTDEMFEP
jgi:4a-hydroxytetrahydrobiopterin dehydratase